MIDFYKYRFVYLAISLTVIIAGIISIVSWGYTYSIDFIGGTNLLYQVQKEVTPKQVQDSLKRSAVSLVSLNIKNKQIAVRLKAIDEKTEARLKNNLNRDLQTKIIVLSSETVGPVLGRETINKTVIASLAAIIGILLYMSFAFKGFKFALAAIIALLHDFFVVVGTYSLMSKLFGAQVDTLFVTAILTTMSFSVHDTIIIFDKVREYIRVEGKGNILYYSNMALTETLVRSLNNSMTIIFMLLALSLLGGSTIKFFIITLLVGTITGTYSSPFVATPLLIWLEKPRK